MTRWSLAFLAALLCASSISAQEVTLETEEAGDRLQGLLRDASLSLSLNTEDAPAPQDYVAAARADYRRLLTALYADGYYGGEISILVDGREAAAIAPLDAPNAVQTITIRVTPGPRFTFGATKIGPLPDGAELPESFQTGEPARSDVIRSSVSTAVTAWRDLGFAKAGAGTLNVVARHAAEALDVEVTINTGPRLSFGPLKVTGNKDVRTARILAIAGLPTGEVYSAAAITAAERRLRDTGAFDSVALIEADDIGPNDTLPVTAQVAEAKPRRFGFGIELSSIEGLRLSSFWMHRNYFGGAERLRVEGDISGIGGETGGIDYTLGTSLKIPAVYGPDTDFLLSGTFSHLEEPDFELDQVTLEGTLTRLVREDLEVSGGLGLVRGRETTDAGTRNFTLLTAPLTATLDRRDDDTNAKFGYFSDLEITPFASIAGADDGVRVFNDTRGYYSFGESDRFTLAARSQVGSVFGANAEDAPADFLFFSGGGGTVRGQPFNSLAIDVMDAGEVIRRGGLSFVGAQLETRIDVTDSIGVVGFYDFGYVGEMSTPGQDGDWHAGAGIGVRYNTGIGPIRLDIATPANGDNAGERVEFYIGIGQAF
ncbi:MAG: autotransporter assembly complex family protein [Pseudomonadota bacterium]